MSRKSEWPTSNLARTVAVVSLVLIDPRLVAARVRAALAYAGIEHTRPPDDLGVSKATLARMVSWTSPRGAQSTDELWAIADRCGVPRVFMEQGWEPLVAADAARRVEEAADELAALRQHAEGPDEEAGLP